MISLISVRSLEEVFYLQKLVTSSAEEDLVPFIEGPERHFMCGGVENII